MGKRSFYPTTFYLRASYLATFRFQIKLKVRVRVGVRVRVKGRVRFAVRIKR
jgi:hypothetical protein